MAAGWATLDAAGGRCTLRFERRLPHPPAKVFRAISDPAELAHWFPALVEAELRPGARMRFTFEGSAEHTTGEVLEFDPPKVFTFQWNGEVLRFELVPENSGCLLVFTHVIDEANGGTLAAPRNAAGWDECLAALAARLRGEDWSPPEGTGRMLSLLESYVERFGLGEGEVLDTPDGHLLRFERDLVWRPPETVWSTLTDGGSPAAGGEPPLPSTHGYQEAGTLTAVEPPQVLEYTWLHDSAPAGRVRWEIGTDPARGTRLVLTQTVPAHLASTIPVALAAWHTHLELFFAALFGEIRCPWPADRTTELERHYTERLATR